MHVVSKRFESHGIVEGHGRYGRSQGQLREAKLPCGVLKSGQQPSADTQSSLTRCHVNGLYFSVIAVEVGESDYRVSVFGYEDDVLSNSFGVVR